MTEKSNANIGFEKRYNELVADGDDFEDENKTLKDVLQKKICKSGSG